MNISGHQFLGFFRDYFSNILSEFPRKKSSREKILVSSPKCQKWLPNL